jgi:Tol biopolymer transport system component
MLPLASLQRQHFRYILLIGFCIVILPLITSCRAGTPTQALPTNTFVEPSVQVSATQPSNQLATGTTEPEFNGQLLLEYGYGDSTGIWIMSPPFDVATPLFTDDDFIYGQAVWSHDGNQIAFSKTAVGCPSPYSSIWISRPDGSEPSQVSEPVQGMINEETGNCDLGIVYPAIPKAWSNDGRIMAIDLLLDPFLLAVETESLTELDLKDQLSAIGLDGESITQYLDWTGFSPIGDRALLTTFTDEFPQVLLWVSLKEPNVPHVLQPPEDFLFDDFGYLGLSHAWSEDGRTIVIPDKSGEQSRLWKVDIEKNTWQIIHTEPLLPELGSPATVLWSLDGKWIAWSSWRYQAGKGVFDTQVTFIETKNWSVTRNLLLENQFESGLVLNWITTDAGESRLAYLVEAPGGGIYLLNPENNIDRLLIPYENLVAQSDELIRVGPWQP